MSLRSISLRGVSSSARPAEIASHLRYAPDWALSVAISVILARRRSFVADAQRLVQGIAPAPRVENTHCIPATGRLLVVTNHYYKPGYAAWWGIALITLAVAQVRKPGSEIIWIMTNRWTYPDWLRSRLVTPLTYWLFSRLARVYGFVSMPPMPPQPQYVDEAVRAVRKTLSLLDGVSGGADLVIGMAPEGRDSADGSLVEPPPGAGRLLHHLSARGLLILPVGVAEVGGVLCARFGLPFTLQLPGGERQSRKELDHQASTRTMIAIARQLPPELWGVYREQLERDTQATC